MFEEEKQAHRGVIITFCVLAASVLWFAFSMQETYTQILELPTEVSNIPAGQALLLEPPSSIQVQVEGEGVQILRLFYNPPRIPINVSDPEIDLMLVVPEYLNNVSLQAVTPRTLVFPAEERSSKKVPVRPVLSMQFAPGYQQVGPVEVTPDSILVTGAQSIIAGIQNWPTERRNVGPMKDSLNAAVLLSDSLSGLVSLSAEEVQVVVDIQEFTEARRTIRVRVNGLPPGRQVQFVPEFLEVVYQVPLSQFDASLIAEDFYVFVPYEDIVLENQRLVYPTLHPPSGQIIRGARLSQNSLRYYVTSDE